MKEVNNREKELAPKLRKLRKSPVTFNIKLTEEQKKAKALALNSTITFFTGRPGTSKSTLACHTALDLLIKGEVDKIIVTRPTIDASKSIGFLPGDAFDFKEGKMAPYVAPILQTMYKLRSKEEIDGMIAKEKIQIIPIQFVRGLNFEDCVVIYDESQNSTAEELKAVVTRICDNAKILFTSDLNQVDLHDKTKSAGHFIRELESLEGVSVIELTENFRHPLALAVMDNIDNQIKMRKVI